jgi:hypothetical protein
MFALAGALSLADSSAPLSAGGSPTNLTAIEGEAFDRAFVEQMIRDEQTHASAEDLSNRGTRR